MTNSQKLPNIIPHIPFDDYRGKFRDFFHLERTTTGVLTARMHTNDGPLLWTYGVHRALHQLTTAVGQDIDTEVFILGGTGDRYMDMPDTDNVVADLGEDFGDMAYNHMYYDGTNMCEGIVFDIEVPTIGLINGPAFHTEIALFCDITICSEDAVIFDPHLGIGWVPGDGIQLAFRHAMGDKRAKYALLSQQRIDAQTALDYGLVNEVVPRGQLYTRAAELAEELARFPRTSRRVTTQVLRAPLKQAMAVELRNAFGSEMFAALAAGPQLLSKASRTNTSGEPNA